VPSLFHAMRPSLSSVKCEVWLTWEYCLAASCVQEASAAVVRVLLAAGADHSLQAADGDSPLMIAVRTNNTLAVQALLGRYRLPRQAYMALQCVFTLIFLPIHSNSACTSPGRFK
jgi:ankyrin repeat protein